MKALTLASTLFATALAVPSPHPVGEVVSHIERRSPQGNNDPLYSSNVQGVKILPRFSMTQPKDGAIRTTVKYGSWMVSSTKMLSTSVIGRGPCPSGCYVTAMEATIRYPDRREANVDTGSWLHHIALFGKGTGMGSIWASGNERPTLRLNGREKFGIDFPSTFMMMVDLMVEDTTAKNLTLEIAFEHVPKTGSGYKGATMYWLTIGEPAAKDGNYKFTTIPMLALGAGDLLYTIGHMHDGGTDMRLFVGSRLVCKSVMHYAKQGSSSMVGMTHSDTGAAAPAAPAAPVAQAPSMDHSAMESMDHSAMAGHQHKRDPHALERRQHAHAMGDGEHIYAPGACTDFGSVARGDRLTAEAWYDANQHPLMAMNGKRENLMGNMRVYIGERSGGGLFGRLRR